jgi:hypothetical protein
MSRNITALGWLSAALLALAACSPAYADRIAEPAAKKEMVAVPPPVESPYEVDLITEKGSALDTYQHNGRFYVLGDANDRYTIRVNNPTNRRVEAVISVDGLDVIDGETADLNKRGYVVPAYGELRVDGFRISTAKVATFRFSSVSDSYAGRKGKDRNVGVIGVAIFEEQAPQEVIVAERPYYDENDNKADKKKAPADTRYRDSADADDDYLGGYDGSAESEPTADAPAPPRAGNTGGAGGKGSVSKSTGGERGKATKDCCANPKKERPGLGTKFGEDRHSAVSWTRFVRANATTPTAMAELRYNNAAGLTALGIPVEVVPDEELITRETADPFPNNGFAQPPPN